MVSTARDPTEEALAWVASSGITVVPWAIDAGPDDHPGGTDPDTPILYLVPPGALAPPRWSEIEDWVRLPTSRDEVYARADRLLARAMRVGAVRTVVDDDDVLRVGDQLLVLSQLEARLMRVLLANTGDVVQRADAVAAMWPDGPPADPRALDNRLKALRQRIGSLPLRVHTVRGRGLLLEWHRPT